MKRNYLFAICLLVSVALPSFAYGARNKVGTALVNLPSGQSVRVVFYSEVDDWMPEQNRYEAEINSVYARYEGAAIVGYNDSSLCVGDVVLPMTFTYGDHEHKLVRICDQAFAGCNLMTSISMPATVSHIDYQAFAGCTSLTDITCTGLYYPGVERGFSLYMSVYAFSGCESLSSFTFLCRTPPTVGGINWLDTTTLADILPQLASITVHYPCGESEDYEESLWGECVLEELPFPYTLTVAPNNANYGTAEIVHHPDCTNDTAEIRATAASGYRFRRWSDNVTSAHRRFLMMDGDVSLTAYFEPTTGIGDVDGEGVSVAVVGGRIVVEGSGERVRVMDAVGRTVPNSDLPAGVYLVRVGEAAPRKVVVMR